MNQYLAKANKLAVIGISFMLILGIFFRFYHLDRKVYWHDEVYTSVRVAGYSNEIIVKEAFHGEIISPQDLLKYQQPHPNNTWKDTLDRLIDHPEHPPLYYLLVRFWWQLFGNSIAATRSLSAVLSLLVFPSIYWLCQELFADYRISWMAVAIVAISPFHVLYAQEAREYSLWTATILLASAILIRAIKKQKLGWWVVYGFSLALNFYVSLLSIFLAIAHSVYLSIVEDFRWKKQIRNLCIAVIISVFLFTPWIQVIISNYDRLEDKTSWTTIARPLPDLLLTWSLHLTSIFIDFIPGYNLAVSAKIAPIILIFIIYIAYFLIIHTSQKKWLFVLSLIIIPASGLILPDIIWGGQKSSITRYFVPCYLGIQIALAYWLIKGKYSWQKFRQAVILIIIFSGIISCLVSSQANTWWNKLVSYNHPVIAEIINRYEQPLLISHQHDTSAGNLIALSYLLDPDVKLILVQPQEIPQIPVDRFEHILIWTNSLDFIDLIEHKYNCKLNKIHKGFDPLWKLQYLE